MDFHKKEWEEKPVVMDKPRRGREMVTTEVPTVKGQQLKGGKEVKNEQEKERDGDVELYHEGWVDGKKYLIPDSNLEIMKDLVNLRIRRKGDSIFVKDKDYHATKLDTNKQFQSKLHAMSEKIDELEAAKLLKKKSMYKTKEPSRSVQESTGSSAAARRKRFEIVPMSDESTTFLISGHIRENYSPLFIIQKYRGKSPFGRRRSDFSQVKSTRNVDILISGNFFCKSVLEERSNAIEGIRLKWDLLVPVDERSNLYERRFSQHFNVKGVDVLFEGAFIKEPGLLNYTPILTFLVPRPEQIRGKEGRRHRKKKNKPAYRSISNIFSQKNVSTYNVQLENKPSMRNMADHFTSREASGVESSADELDGLWSNTDWFDGEDPARQQIRGHVPEDKNDNVSYQIRLVMMSPKTGKRSVAGGSSVGKLPEGRTSGAVAVEQDGARRNARGVDEEESVVFYATRDAEYWSPMCSVEPSLKADSSHSSCEWRGGSPRSDRREQGDACHDRSRCTTACKREELTGSNKSRGFLYAGAAGTRHRNLPAPETTSSNKGDAAMGHNILEYKCQVRPSKKRSQGNSLLGHISRLFSK